MQEKQSNSTDPDRTGDRGLMKACDANQESAVVTKYMEIGGDGSDAAHRNMQKGSLKSSQNDDRISADFSLYRRLAKKAGAK